MDTKDDILIIASEKERVKMNSAWSVIASIIEALANLGAGMVSTGPAIIFGVIILLIGHSLNLFIGALGAYVHTSRLQYVEFFGKFYEGGGRLFKPLKHNNKYTNI